MGDKAELELGSDQERAQTNESATGWDPYEVWLTRVRLQQQFTALRVAGTVGPERPRARIRALGYITSLVRTLRMVVREI